MSRIAFIGGGSMSSCIFNGILKTKAADAAEMTVSGPHLEKLQPFAEAGAVITSDNTEASRKSEIIFLGVKPQMLTGVLQELAAGDPDFKHKLIVSMAAGFLCSSIVRICGAERLIRIMPNTPAKLGLGIVGFYCAPQVSAADKKCCLELLQGLGQIIEVKDEEGLNVIGCVAGSSPAFLYRFLEALITETAARGFSEEEARQIIEQMALGTASMCIANPKTPLSLLREAVTSKGGTTYEGLQKMTEYKFEEMVSAAVQAAMDKTHKFEEMF